MKIFEVIFQAVVDGETWTHCATVYAETAEAAQDVLANEMNVSSDMVNSIREVADLPDSDLKPRVLH